ncbi:hypothetical protein [Myxosarcina sp. GI1]|uniref:hypothetical protein n=1 Tax=Myxosarcina sp. GI1 TaxID=1541065 RepID=UPI00055F8D91|nr:hypothetical protein [Myxosarcina sp. GI1]
MSKTFVASGILLFFCGFPAFAQEAIERVPARKAKGIEAKVVEINIHPYDSGSTIVNFRPTQEKIRQVSLVGSSLFLSSDDPECLSSLPESGGRPCQATLLYLQRKPVELVPKERKVERTRMSVITDENIYVFDIVLSDRQPTYSVVEILAENRQYTPLVSIEQITNYRRGFQVAVSERYLNNPELHNRLRNFINLVRTENTVEAAAAKAGISMKVVRKLEELGNRQPLPNKLQTPLPVVQ